MMKHTKVTYKDRPLLPEATNYPKAVLLAAGSKRMTKDGFNPLEYDYKDVRKEGVKHFANKLVAAAVVVLAVGGVVKAAEIGIERDNAHFEQQYGGHGNPGSENNVTTEQITPTDLGHSGNSERTALVYHPDIGQNEQVPIK